MTQHRSDFARFIVRGSSNSIKQIQSATEMVFSALKAEHPDISFEWEDCGYIDEVGGHHDSGVGWSPDGHYCGECCSASCSDCRIWEWRQKKEIGVSRNNFKSTMRAKLAKSRVSLKD